MDKLICAFAEENIAPLVLIPLNPKNVEILLSKSYCRRCGKCCQSNPEDPGVMVFEEELRTIAKHSKYSYKYLKRHSLKYENPERDDVRHLPLPCIFYDKAKCTIYPWRPIVCRLYPIKDSQPRNGKVYITISLRCDYGKDIYRNIFSYQKKKGQSQLLGI
jgi:Fe-S-cluster containining protein